MSDTTVVSSSPPIRVIVGWTAFLLSIVAAGWAGNRLLGGLFDSTLKRGRPPVLNTVQSDLRIIERDGRSVSFSDLRGKVSVVGYLYTICPHGCATVISEMKKLLEEHGSRSDFQLVSVTVVPERDTPEMLKGFAQALGVKPTDPWWFLSGDHDAVDAFMSRELRLDSSKPIPEEERLNPLDIYSHDLRLTLLDRQGRVRGHYHVVHPQEEIAQMSRVKLRHDVTNLLNDPKL